MYLNLNRVISSIFVNKAYKKTEFFFTEELKVMHREIRELSPVIEDIEKIKETQGQLLSLMTKIMQNVSYIILI